MAAHADAIVGQVHQEFQELVAYVTGPQTQTSTAYEVELTLFRRLLALGATLLRLFFLTRAARRPAGPIVSPTGTPLAYHDRRQTTYYSVFGKVRFARHAYTAPGQSVVCPLDAALGLPARCYSDLLREWASYSSTDAAYRETQTVLARILGLPLSVQALETSLAEDGVDVGRFYEQPPVPPPPASPATILVAQADGTGVPLVRPPAAPPRPVRRGKGQPPGTKKEAIVTSVYTIAPYPRTPAAIVEALLAEPEMPTARPGLRPVVAPTDRPQPLGKEVRATLAGKEAALRRLATRVAQYAGAHIQQRVALTDGAAALQQAMQAHLPGHILVLDIIHAAEHLWAAANALLGERHPDRTAWVRTHLEQLVSGQTAALLADLAQAGQAPPLTAAQRKVVQQTIGYYQRNLPYMRYDEYLAQGWPIGTGVVEGACGHLVQDRLEQAGMRWTAEGAEAMLDLRAVRLNGHWDAYWQFHRQHQQQRLYGASAGSAAPAEADVLERAA